MACDATRRDHLGRPHLGRSAAESTRRSSIDVANKRLQVDTMQVSTLWRGLAALLLAALAAAAGSPSAASEVIVTVAAPRAVDPVTRFMCVHSVGDEIHKSLLP